MYGFQPKCLKFYGNELLSASFVILYPVGWGAGDCLDTVVFELLNGLGDCSALLDRALSAF